MHYGRFCYKYSLVCIFLGGVGEPTAAYEILNKILVSSHIPEACIAFITEKNSMVSSILYAFITYMIFIYFTLHELCSLLITKILKLLSTIWNNPHVTTPVLSEFSRKEALSDRGLKQLFSLKCDNTTKHPSYSMFQYRDVTQFAASSGVGAFFVAGNGQDVNMTQTQLSKMVVQFHRVGHFHIQ